MADDVQLTDLEVIQRFSLAVRGATAGRADVIAALEADLAWLVGGRRSSPAAGATEAAAKSPARKTAKSPAKAPAKSTRARKA
ncbi:MAG: hypothetical protein WCD35_00245 [Mycobacteriales bacterium]